MKIGLIDVDSHNFPNLCLMKLSAYHKAKGHTVEWWNAKGRYDLVYKSRVFTDTYSKDTITVTNAEQVIFGGTGYDTKNRLPPEVEHSYPDYSIYPQFFGIAYGFLSRGCPRNCGFCIVSSKEGRKSVKVADLSEFWKWQPEIKIMDATDMSREQIEASGFGFHHASEDGKYLIMGNGTQAYAIAAEQPQRDNPLKHVEDTIEQNDNNFDGIINNTPQTPTVADLEQRAKAGEAISVTDLAKAVKAEKREQPQKKPSILKKLDEYKKQAAQQPKDKQKEHKKDLEV